MSGYLKTCKPKRLLSAYMAESLGFVLALIMIFISSSPSFSLSEPKQFNTVSSKKYGFTFQLPDHWKHIINTDGSLVINGKDKSGAENSIIILQVLSKKSLKNSSDLKELKKLYEQIKKQPNFQHLADNYVPVAGSRAPYFSVQYEAKSKGGEAVTYKHIHLSLDHVDNYYLLSYRAPLPVYDSNEKVFKHLISTFKFDNTKNNRTSLNTTPPPTKQKLKNSVDLKTNNSKGKKFVYYIRVPKGWRDEKRKDGTRQIYSKSKRSIVFIITIDLEKTTDVKQWADAAEESFTPLLPFMTNRKLRTKITHPGTGLANSSILIREYDGRYQRNRVKSYVAYAVHGTHAYMIAGFARQRSKRDKRNIIKVIQSFSLTKNRFDNRQASQSGPPKRFSSAHLNAARKTLALTKTIDQYRAAMHPMISKGIKKNIAGIKPTPSLDRDELYKSVMMRLNMPERFAQIGDQMARVYASTFSLSELKRLNRFFRKGVGRKWIESQPIMSKKSEVIGKKWGYNVSRDAKNVLKHALNERGLTANRTKKIPPKKITPPSMIGAPE